MSFDERTRGRLPRIIQQASKLGRPNLDLAARQNKGGAFRGAAIGKRAVVDQELRRSDVRDARDRTGQGISAFGFNIGDCAILHFQDRTTENQDERRPGAILRLEARKCAALERPTRRGFAVDRCRSCVERRCSIWGSIERHDVGEPRVCDDDANVDPEPEQAIALGGDRVDVTVRAGVRSKGNDGTGQGG